MLPSVTIITPTTNDRLQFNLQLEDHVRMQDYKGQIQHIWDYGYANIGEKRNSLCAQAKGDIIIHMDSDDFYSSHWVSACVESLKSCDMTGLKSCIFNNKGTRYLYEYGDSCYIVGATMCYRKKVWDAIKFPKIQQGEDTAFLDAVMNAGFIVKPHNYINEFTAIRHNANTTKVDFTGHNFTRIK